MATLTDIFNADGFSTYELTDAIQRIQQPQMSIATALPWRVQGVRGTKVAIEELDLKLGLVSFSPRGTTGTPGPKTSRVLIPLEIPHLQLEGSVLADDILNVRGFGKEDGEAINDLITQRLSGHRSSIEATHEFHRAAALDGKVLDADGSTVLNVFTADSFNQDQTTGELDLEASDTIIRTQVMAQLDKSSDALGAVAATGYVAITGSTFFDQLIDHENVRQSLLNSVSNTELRPALPQFDWASVRWIRYRGKASGTDFVNPEQAFLCPIADIYRGYAAPADTMEAAGTLGQLIYSRQYIAEGNKRVIVETQSNVMWVITRPNAIVKISIGAGSS